MKFFKEAEKILASMTLAEKIGQMNLVTITAKNLPEMLEQAAQGKFGAYLTYEDSSSDPEIYKKLMDASKSSRTGIPVLFGKDVIHGHWTVFPIGLGMAAGFNPSLVEEAYRIAAKEASSEGINWSFTPMIDIARDPRWGRIAEGFGEDPYLTARMAEAAVWGLQGRKPEELANEDRILACPKHFIGYGAAEGGRDANTVEISASTLMNIYFPPYLAAFKAGAGSVMSGYHDLNGEPVSASRYLLETLIKKIGGLDGFIVSDYGTTSQLCKYRFAEDEKHATGLAANSGLDMDMCSYCFPEHLESLVKEGVVPEERINDAVLRILAAKLRLNLWERSGALKVDKKKYAVPAEYFDLAVESARNSSILLANRDGALPLSKDIGKLYVTGPFANAKKELFGTWCLDGLEAFTPSVLECLKTKLADVEIKHEDALFTDRAVKNAEFIETVVYLGGESPERSGERNNISELKLPQGQEEQILSLSRQGKKVILVVVAGRPLSLANILPHVSAVLYVFHPGTGGGEAVARILTGEAEPGGRLPVTIPWSEGQIPLYYNSIQTRDNRPEHLRYIDLTEKPLFSFGYGLTYTSFKLSGMELDRAAARRGEAVKASVLIENTGARAGEAVVQCYIQDCVSSVLRPVKELKGFKRMRINPGAAERVEFSLGPDELGCFGPSGDWTVEPGRFKVFIGTDSQDTLEAGFELLA